MRVSQSYRNALLALACVFAVACAQTQRPFSPTAVQDIESPAGLNSGQPSLAVAGDRPVLSWVERLSENNHALKFSTFEGEGWSQPRTVAQGADWFVNWADFPSMAALPDGSLIAHWLVKSGPGTYAYNVNVARSSDGGLTWSSPVVPHRDATQTEHGFVSLLPWTEGRGAVVWLDGRKFQSGAQSQAGGARVVVAHAGMGSGDAGEEMTLRFAAIAADGSLSEEAELDDRVCDCCQTAAAFTSEGAVVVYRDRSAEEVRDISIIRYRDGRWTQPRTLHEDGWQISGCPVNGPAVAAEAGRVAVAWFTQAQEDRPRVQVIFSEDAGETFGPPVEVAGDDTLGRVEVVLLADGSALVGWMEIAGRRAAIKARRVRADGTSGEPFTVAETGAERASGFPRMARVGQDVVIAWTDAADKDAATHVRTALIKPGTQ